MRKARKPTYIELKALLNYMLKIKPPDFDLRTIGVNPQDIETVKTFWERYCSGLTYRECKEQVKRLIPRVQEWRYSSEEESHYIMAQAEEYFMDKYGTHYIYELFKHINDEEHEDFPALYEYVMAKYRCLDVGAEKLTLFPLEVRDNIEEFLNSFLIGGYTYARDIRDLEDFRTRIAVVSPSREGKLLFCYTKDENRPKGIPLTSSLPKVGVIAWSRKKMAILL